MTRAPRVGVAVMAHPKRATFVDELLPRLDRPAEVVWDRRNDRWDTGSRAMLAHRDDPQATHWLIVQDDAVICRDLVAGVERALAHVPAKPGAPTPLCLYIGTVTPYHRNVSQAVADAGEGVSWLTMGGVFWGVGIVMPTELIDPMVRWGHTRGAYIANYDKRIGTWLDQQRITTWYPWPNLVDHRDSPSLVSRNRLRGRHAHRFVGRDVSALGLDWSGGVRHIPSIRRYHGGGTRPAHPKRGDLIVKSKKTDLPASPDLMTPRGVNTRTLRLTDVAGAPAGMAGRHKLIPGVTVAHADSWIVRYRPELWAPLTIDYPAGGDGPAGSVDSAQEVAADLLAVLARLDALPADEQDGARQLVEAVRPVDADLSGPLTSGPGTSPAPPETPAEPPDATAPSPDGPSAAEVADAYAEGHEIKIADPPVDPPAAPSAREVRAWAKQEGIEVPSRGPLPDEIVDRYRAANARSDW